MHQVGADGEVVAIAGDDEGLEVAHGVAVGVKDLGHQADDVLADRVFLGMQFDGGHAVAQVDERGAGVALTMPCDWRKSATVAMPGGWSTGTYSPRVGSKTCLPPSRYQVDAPERRSFSALGAQGRRLRPPHPTFRTGPFPS